MFYYFHHAELWEIIRVCADCVQKSQIMVQKIFQACFIEAAPLGFRVIQIIMGLFESILVITLM